MGFPRTRGENGCVTNIPQNYFFLILASHVGVIFRDKYLLPPDPYTYVYQMVRNSFSEDCVNDPLL